MSNFADCFGGLTVGQAIELNEKAKKNKNEIITKLYMIWKNKEIPAVYRRWVQQAAKYINDMEAR